MKHKLTVIAIAALLVLATGCTKPDEAIATLQREGYQDISIVGYYPLACSEDDTFRTGFTATKNGQPVEGVVCRGFMKGSTVRTF